jgi:hypothetical protein
LPDSGFKPYYERFLSGDLRAIENYCNEKSHWSPAFYELLGRLFLFRHYGAVPQILAGVERSTKVSGVPRRPVYEYWYEFLLPLCQRERKFIRQARATSPGASRRELWSKYLSQLPALDDDLQAASRLAEWSDLSSRANESEKPGRHAAIQELREWSERHADASVESVERFSQWGMVCRPIFFDLASTQPLLTPAAIARRYACKIAGVSESWASRKTVRK